MCVKGLKDWGRYTVVSHLSFCIKGQTGHAVGVDVPQDGHCLHAVGVPYADEGVFPNLTGGHLHLVRVDGQAARHR